MQGTAAPDPNRSVSSHPPDEPAEIATPTGISLPAIVAQARGTKTGNQPRDVVAPRLAGANGREAPSKVAPRTWCHAALTPCWPWDASLAAKQTTSSSGLAAPLPTTLD